MCRIVVGKEGETAMKYRKWDAKTKGMIVPEGLKGKPVSDICIEYQKSAKLNITDGGINCFHHCHRYLLQPAGKKKHSPERLLDSRESLVNSR